MPWAAFQGVGGELDVGCGAAGAALRHHVTGTTFTPATLGGHTQFELDLVETHTGVGMAGNFAVGDSAADTDDHGLACWLVIR